MKRCPTPRRQSSGDLECPSCGRVWDFQEDPPLCDRRHEPDVDKANAELQRMRDLLKK